jgi:SAM-dependent methyltransferase
MGQVHRRYAEVTGGEAPEALGQLAAPENLDEDMALCPLQTIEPYFLKYLPQSGKILEAGSGRGRWVVYLRRKGFDVVGIDLARSNVAFAKAYDETIPVSHGDVLDTGFADGSFAAIISLGVVEHFEDGPQRAFRETRRILKRSNAEHSQDNVFQSHQERAASLSAFTGPADGV